MSDTNGVTEAMEAANLGPSEPKQDRVRSASSARPASSGYSRKTSAGK